MALRSMTGFGQAESVTQIGTFHAEIRSVNNRFLDIQLRTPRAFSPLEALIKKTITENVARGSITLYVNWERESTEDTFSWDKGAVKQYVRVLKEIQQDQKLGGHITIDQILSFSDIITVESATYTDEFLWDQFSPVLCKALQNFEQTRVTEAQYIKKDLKQRLDSIDRIRLQIAEAAPARLERYTSELREKIGKIAGGVIDEQRLATEIAIMADRLDISEETTRLGAHVETFGHLFEATESVGKRMGFFLQEMHREANTIGSKANDAQISHLSVDLKENIEKIREQIQNIE
ncbi:MAG: YicC/YloC family endoribonuclease [Fibrobacterota bacterium]